MRKPLRRYYGRGDRHFVTFSCYRRRTYLGTPRARDAFVKTLDQVRARWEFPLLGYVVMPEHVHLLMGEPAHGDPSKVLQALKQTTSRVLRAKEMELRGFDQTEDDAEPFWQRRFYDFNVRSAEKVTEKLEYMHANPVKRGLIAHPGEWTWSSWSYYERGVRGLISIDSVENEK